METHDKSSTILHKLLNNNSHYSDSIAPSSIALPVWLDGHGSKEASNKRDSNHASTFNLDSNKIDSYPSSGPLNPLHSDIRSASIRSHSSSSLSSPHSSFDSTASPPPILPTTPTSYWWRPHFTKLPSLKHNYDFTNIRNVDSSHQTNGFGDRESNNNNYSRANSPWIVIIGSCVGIAIACVIICALFACTNCLFFPPRRKQQIPKC